MGLGNRIRLAALAFFTLTFAACGGSGTAPAPPQNTTRLSLQQFPAPLDPAAPDSAIDRTPLDTNAKLPRGANLKALRHGVSPLSVAEQNDHEDAGFLYSESGRYTSLFALHEIHPHLHLPYPPGSSGTEYLFAPTTKEGCLENVTVYYADGTGTHGQFAVFDWCNTLYYIAAVSVDAAFLRDYVLQFGNDTGFYATEIYTHDLHPATGSKWYALLFNFRTLRWNSVAEVTQQPADPGYGGWSIFETYLLAGPCPSLPPVHAESIEFYDNVARQWRLARPSLPAFDAQESDGPPGSCFVPDTGGPPTYYSASFDPDYAWTVVSRR